MVDEIHEFVEKLIMDRDQARIKNEMKKGKPPETVFELLTKE
jgi:hypothetical protein